MHAFSTIIKEGVPTPNGRVYPEGSLQKIKEQMQADIENGRCLMFYGIDTEKEITDTNLNKVAGIVKEFRIEDGQEIFDVELTPTFQTIMFAFDRKYEVDFFLNAKIKEEKTPEGLPIVDLEGSYIAGVRLVDQTETHNEDDEFDLTCPHCNTTFRCYPGGYSLHCFDYRTVDGKTIYGTISTGMLVCPDCGKEFKEE